MSSDPIAQQIDYGEVVESIDMEEVLEGTRWEGSFDKDEPFAKELLGLIGAMGGYALGEILGQGLGSMLDRKLEAMDERMSEDEEDDGTEEANQEGDDGQEQSASSTGPTSDQQDDRDQEDGSAETSIDQEEIPSLVEDSNESFGDGPDEDVSDIGGDSL